MEDGTKEIKRAKDEDGAHTISSHATVKPGCRKIIYLKTEL